MKYYTNKYDNLQNGPTPQKTKRTRIQPIDNLNCLITIEQIEFIIIISPQKKSLDLNSFPGEIYQAFKEE